jgi:hypothetical protein
MRKSVSPCQLSPEFHRNIEKGWFSETNGNWYFTFLCRKKAVRIEATMAAGQFNWSITKRSNFIETGLPDFFLVRKKYTK